MPGKYTPSPNPLAVRLVADDLEWLRAQREATGTSVNAMISRAVAQYRRRVEAANARKVNHGATDR